MSDVTRQNFGFLIAYILPGFVACCGAAIWFPSLWTFLNPTGTAAAGVEGTFLVTVASLAAGMTVSALRWLLVDAFHHRTGLVRPHWDDANLPSRLDAFAAIVDDHYRYYQFHANMAIAVAILYAAWRFRQPTSIHASAWTDVAFWFTEVLFLATSRDNLRRYYARAARLLGSLPQQERSSTHVERQPPAEARGAEARAGEARRQKVGEEVQVAS